MPELSLNNLLREARLSHRNLADLLDVSYQMVSNWCSGRNHPRPDKLAKIAEALRERGVQVSMLAAYIKSEAEYRGFSNSLIQSLEEPNTGFPDIGIICWNTSSPILQAATLTLQQGMARGGFNSVVLDCLRNHQIKHMLYDFVTRARFRGVFVFVPRDDIGGEEELQQFANALARHNQSAVFLSERPENLPKSIAAVTWDHEGLAKSATKLLISRGRNRLGGIFVGSLIPFRRYSLNGYIAALDESGKEYRDDWVVWGDTNPLPGQPPLEESIEYIVRNCDGAVIYGLHVLPMVTSILHHLRVPADQFALSGVGYPTYPYYDRWEVSVIVIPYVPIARLGAQLMLQLLSGSADHDKGPPRHIAYTGPEEIIELGGRRRVRSLV